MDQDEIDEPNEPHAPDEPELAEAAADRVRGSLWIWAGLLGCGISLVAGFKSADDFLYWRYSRITKGKVTAVVPDVVDGPRGKYAIWYLFTDRITGRRIRSSTYVDAADRFKYAHGKPIDVEYLGGALPRARILGTGNRIWPVVFAISSSAMLITLPVATMVVVRKSRAESRLEIASARVEADESHPPAENGLDGDAS